MRFVLKSVHDNSYEMYQDIYITTCLSLNEGNLEEHNLGEMV
jgi:hypothetical protein